MARMAVLGALLVTVLVAQYPTAYSVNSPIVIGEYAPGITV